MSYIHSPTDDSAMYCTQCTLLEARKFFWLLILRYLRFYPWELTLIKFLNLLDFPRVLLINNKLVWKLTLIHVNTGPKPATKKRYTLNYSGSYYYRYQINTCYFRFTTNSIAHHSLCLYSGDCAIHGEKRAFEALPNPSGKKTCVFVCV